MKLINNYILIFSVACLLFASCREQQWDEHNKLYDGGAGKNLLEAIQAHPDGSKFYEAVIKTGYDTLLMQASNYTVFVPKNDVWQAVDMNNEAELKSVVGYHIAYGKYLSSQPELYNTPLKMLNTKMVKYDAEAQTFKGATIVSADNVAGNGVFHVIDRLMDLKKNVWDIVLEMNDLKHVQYLSELDHLEMDRDRSIEIGVDATGKPVYDIVWVTVNNFLRTAPLNNEDSVYTYILLKDGGFDMLKNKYLKYFISDTEEATDSLAKFNVCQDFVFRGIVDIGEYEELTNIFDVKVPLKGANIEGPYEASNGRVYVIDHSDILLNDKFKPIIIEGENYNGSAGSSMVYVRYKTWASGLKDVMLSCSTTQRDEVADPEAEEGVRTFNTTFHWDTNNRANMNNFWIEYKVPVTAVDYEIHYVAFDDIENHVFDSGSPLRPPARIVQKLFISMPWEPALRKSNDTIINNYRKDICFVAQDTAGIYKERKMTQWKFDSKTGTQFILEPVDEPDAHLLKVNRAGVLTLWLCNTTGSEKHTQTNGQSAQGMLFLDYIKLVPILEEP